MKEAPVVIYTDGACSKGKGGWAAILFYGEEELVLYGNEDYTTNNRMELTAILKALQSLIRPCTVEIYSDSQYCVNGVNGWIDTWAKNGWMRSPTALSYIPNQDLWREIYDQLQIHKVKAHWVKGHNNDPNNELVDKLAQHMRQQAV